MAEDDQRGEAHGVRFAVAAAVGLLIAAVAVLAGWRGTAARLHFDAERELTLAWFLASEHAPPILLFSILSGVVAFSLFFTPKRASRRLTLIEVVATLVVGSIVGVAVSVFHVPWGH